MALLVFLVPLITGAADDDRMTRPKELSSIAQVLLQNPQPILDLPSSFSLTSQAGQSTPSSSDGKAKAEADGEFSFVDNSFLIEEAYNQGPGVVQHIFNFVRGWDEDRGHSRTFDFLFIQEWPIGSQRHQFSYQIPASRVFEHPNGEPSFEADGIGDIQLNYRLQALGSDTPVFGEKDSPLLFAPRFSVILPTGDEDEGLGSGEVGYQINLPVSREFENWTLHLNAGLTVLPDVKAMREDPTVPVRGQTLNGYNLGASAIYFVRPNLHAMLEWVSVWDEEATATGSADYTFEMLLSPGIRWAAYTEGDTQLVFGAGLPIGLSTDATDISLFLYMSFEHRYKETAEK